MAQASTRPIHELDSGFVLTPERYDPRRSSLFSLYEGGRQLQECVRIERKMVSPRTAPLNTRYAVIDAGDAKEGFVQLSSPPVSARDIGSAKKLVQVGDVIISRLRPYLRQVALIDGGICAEQTRGDTTLAVSTEFYVLRPHDASSIAFLIPFLLSSGVQRVLAAAQEGGHHPRFPEKTLITLTVPQLLIKERIEISAAVESALAAMRSAVLRLRNAIGEQNVPFQ